jgi:hypothetical protein
VIDDISAVVPPAVTPAEAVTPAPELPPPGEATLPAPTVERAQAVDHVFCTPHSHHPHPLVTLLGVAASVGLLRDLAVDTFDTSDEDEKSEPGRKNENQPEPTN